MEVENLKDFLEEKITEKQFNLPVTSSQLSNYILSDQEFMQLSQLMGDEVLVKNVLNGIARFSFFIELVKEDVKSTKFTLRWDTRLINDPRFSTFDECVEIYRNLVNQLISTVSQRDDILEYLSLFSCYNIIPYELPIDYISRYPRDRKIHTIDNIYWCWDDEILEAIKLRAYITSSETNPEAILFRQILVDKIKTKTYLTDRAQTGDHKTNREKRWETHPNSVQFALRKDCLMIERKLVLQLVEFRNAPNTLITNLKSEGLIPSEYPIYSCPITGIEMCFNEFKSSILMPTHGRSPFQVGHLNPLKAINTNPSFGHSSQNISWLSENGNRIQGSLTLNEVNQLLEQICENRFSNVLNRAE